MKPQLTCLFWTTFHYGLWVSEQYFAKSPKYSVRTRIRAPAFLERSNEQNKKSESQSCSNPGFGGDFAKYRSEHHKT